MKVLLTVHQFFPQYASGTEVLTRSVAQELISRGHEVHVLTGYPTDKKLLDKDRIDEYDYEGIHVFRFHHGYTPMAGQASMVELGYNNRLAAMYFERILNRIKPDVVHFFHLDRLGTNLIDCAAQVRIPAFLTPTDFWAICPTGQLVLCDGSLCRGPSTYAGNCVKHVAQRSLAGLIGTAAGWLPVAWVELLARLTKSGVLLSYPYRAEVGAISSRLDINIARLNNLSKIVSPNRFMSELLIEHGVSPDLITHSAYGIELTEYEPIVPRPPPRRPFRVGFIGSLVQHKGCHILIDAFKALPNGRAVLKVYGNTGDFPEYSNKLKRLADSRGDIEFCGTFHNSRIAEVLADLDVLVVPSLWYENTPLVVYSAQAARCPVVASDFPGISEIILDDVNGLLFEAGNTGDLARLLHRLIDESAITERLSANSRVPKTITLYVDELLSIWNSV